MINHFIPNITDIFDFRNVETNPGYYTTEYIIILYLHNTPMWVKQIQIQTNKT